ncbi:damage-control phosphatase ARMT1-like [Scaptodrosophila lebanonensis]|uniref:Sugar phosphate phosphatase n=1 Tax=Drosophila lebanonensis TaxID=7225 RepID=A0A6J2U8E6_DROLE|nr:damage-control phosphatase ARMT1-like [Scaptodrosophila lebanonensis]
MIMFGDRSQTRSAAQDAQLLVEAMTPRYSLLSGRFKQSFAYLALQTRMPGIMSQIVAQLQSNMPELEEQFGEEVRKDVPNIVDAIERLSRELKRDRYFSLFHGNEPDKAEWNAFISELPKPKRSYFRACWLHAECYLYRRIYSIFEHSHCLRTYDYFGDLKHEDLKASVQAMEAVGKATCQMGKSWSNFSLMMRLNAWSNHFELFWNSMGGNAKLKARVDVKSVLDTFENRLLANDSILVWNCLVKAKLQGKQKIIVDYICDNAGFELFTDFIFLAYLVEAGLATQVRLHVKSIPWYISDVTKRDIDWTLGFLQQHPSDILSTLGYKWLDFFRNERFIMAPESYFWTGPQPYFVMVDVNLDLFHYLSQAELAIFKGDLNYRKLTGDFIWDSMEDFITCLRGFRPTNVCAIRTVKCEVICGLPEGVADKLVRTDPQWMTSGRYSVIQYTDSLRCNCWQHEMEGEQPDDLGGMSLRSI